MKVLSVGAAGRTAGLVVRALADRGVTVRGLVHSPDKQLQARTNGAAETVVADLNDQAALAEALEGVDGVFHIIPAFVPDEAATGTVMVRAAEAARVRRLVFSSVYHPSLDDLSNHRDKQAVEQALYDSSLEFVILQPAMFMSQLDGLASQAKQGGTITGGYSSSSTMSYVDYRDVAELAAAAFLDDRMLYGTFELASPGMFSRDDIAARLAELLGRPVAAQTVSPQLPGTMPQEMRDGLARMMGHYDRVGFHGGNALVLQTLLGRTPMTVERYLAAAVAT